MATATRKRKAAPEKAKDPIASGNKEVQVYQAEAGVSALKPYVVGTKEVPQLQLKVGVLYRGFHSDPVADLAQNIRHNGWLVGKPILVVASKDTPDTYFLVDGVHRLCAVRRLVKSEIFPEKYEIPCTVLRHDTPKALLIAEAGKLNQGNEVYIKMTTVDKVIWTKNAIFGILQSMHLEAAITTEWSYSPAMNAVATSDKIYRAGAQTGGSASGSKEGLGESTVEKLNASFRAWYSLLDYEHESLELTSSLKPCTPWTFACAVNNLTALAKIDLRAMYHAAWKKYVATNLKHMALTTQKSWPMVVEPSAKSQAAPWTDAEVYNLSMNLYCEAHPWTNFAFEWKIKPGQIAKKDLHDWDQRPCTLMYLRSLLAMYVMHGRMYKEGEDLKKLVGNIASALKGGKPLTRFTELWVGLRLIAEPTHTMGETALYEAKTMTETDDDITQQKQPLDAQELPEERGALQNVSDDVNDPSALWGGDCLPHSTRVNIFEMAQATFVESQDEYIELSQAIDMTAEEKSQYEIALQANDQLYGGCCYLRYCFGSSVRNNRLLCCADCVAKKKVGAKSTCCINCVVAKRMGRQTTEGLTPEDLAEAALCLDCWRIRALKIPKTPKAPLVKKFSKVTRNKALRVPAPDMSLAQFQSVFELHAKNWTERTGKACKTFQQIADLPEEDQEKTMDDFEDMKVRAQQILMCLEMQYFDGCITQIADKILEEWAQLLEVPAIVQVPFTIDDISVADLMDVLKTRREDAQPKKVVISIENYQLAMRTHRLEHYAKASVQEVDEEAGFIGSSVTLHHDTWQNWWTKVLEGTVPHQDVKLQPETFKIIWWDPMYDASQQPSPAEMLRARDMIEYFAADDCVVMVWGTFDVLPMWREMLQAPLTVKSRGQGGTGRDNRAKICDKKIWKVEKTPFTVIRSPARMRSPRTVDAFKNYIDFCLIAYRQVGIEKGKFQQHVKLNLDQMEKYYPANDHGLHANVLTGYRPPTKTECLKDAKNKPLRPMAEKTAELARKMLLRFVHLPTTTNGKLIPGSKVLDLYAGSATMGMACMSLGLTYYGVEQNIDVVEAAEMRLGALYEHRLTYGLESGYGSIQAEKEIFNPLLMKRVSNYLCSLKDNNIPISITTGMAVEEDGCPFLPRCDIKLIWDTGSDPTKLENVPTVEPKEVFEAKKIGQQRGLYSQRTYKVNDDMPLFFWGEIKTKAIAFEEAGGRDNLSDFPGVTELPTPYQEYVIIIDARCPAALINDPGEGGEANVDFNLVDQPHLQELKNREHDHCMFHAKAIKDIEVGDQILVHYGKVYWNQSTSRRIRFETDVALQNTSEEDDSGTDSNDEGETASDSDQGEKIVSKKKTMAIPKKPRPGNVIF